MFLTTSEKLVLRHTNQSLTHTKQRRKITLYVSTDEATLGQSELHHQQIRKPSAECPLKEKRAILPGHRVNR